MAKIKKDKQNKNAASGIITRARDLSSKTLCRCDQSNVIKCVVQLPKTHKLSSSKETDNVADLQDLVRLISMRKGGGSAKVDVDSEGNLVWRQPAVGKSYGGGVGRIGRIDEDKPCCFSEEDVHSLWYSRSGSITARNAAH